MGRGRPPKSTETHILEGTYKKKQHEDRGIKFSPAKEIEMPSTLKDKKTVDCWKKIVPALCEKGLVSIVEVPVLEYAFECYQNAQQCNKVIEDAGGVTVYLTTLDYRAKDLTRYRSNFMTEFNNIMFKFGITPAENPKVRQQIKKDENDVSDILSLSGRM